MNKKCDIMSEDKIHIRTPILQILRRSPFEGLQKHFECIKLGIIAWEKTINFYLAKDYANFEKYAKRVDKYEQKADYLKGNIRNHLPNFVFLPTSKIDFLMLLKETDGILDGAKDVVVLMEMRKTIIPKEMEPNFKDMLRKSIQVVEILEKVMDLLRLILESSFGGKPREEIKKYIHKIHKIEHESDVIEKRLSKQLFNNSTLDPISVLHLLKIVDRFGSVADHVENAGDRIRAMLAK
jgi:predicted phosphate transport protein (TIGR00153 family)